VALSNTYDTRLLRLRQETAAGAGAQILLVVLLGTAIGLGPAGWLTGLAFALATWAILTHALSRSWPRPPSFGPANRVTLARAILVGGVTTLVAVILDAVDGQVARRTGTATLLGARFDMEVDAVLILVLSVYVAVPLGAWVLLIGVMRYVFVAAARVLPWLRGPLPPSTARKAVAALQGIVLLVAGAGIIPRPAAFAAVLLALALLVWSFGRDIRWLWRVRAHVAQTPPSGSSHRGTFPVPVNLGIELTPSQSRTDNGGPTSRV
jgi:phosphatidylglycerophosphate synthase